MRDLITIDKNEILQFKQEGSNLVVKKQAEEALVKLLDLKDLIDRAVEEVKEAITSSGKSVLGDNFKGVIGERVKAIYRAYGDKYQTQNSQFQKEVTFKRPDVDKIEQYVKENGELPKATTEKARPLKLIISRINEK